MKLLVVGTLAFDSVETPFGQAENVLGGSASYLATSASFFTQPQIVGVVGEDFPQEHLDFFVKKGIDCTGVQKTAGKTFRWAGSYHGNMNEAKTHETQLNVLESFRPDLPEHYKNTPYVFLGNIDPDLQMHVISQLTDTKLVACDTMNFWIEGRRSSLMKTLEKVDLLSINDGEAKLLSGEENIVTAAQAIRQMGPKYVVIKRGEYGAILFTEESMFAAPAIPLEVVKDPTGAGDTFAGGMLGYLAHMDRVDDRTLRQAIIVGSTMASFTVQDFSLNKLQTLQESDIQKCFEEFVQLTQFERNLYAS
ncbi:MAG: PfkB family carbohydrate kinase [Myxococcota bacterium]|nr:PfkB family carbohydrate kinase [Myxococcota bacterium]